MYLKARLVDDMFARLLEELEARGELENTVIIAFTDHYTYGINDTQLMLDRSGVDDLLLLEKTPCFLWSPDLPAMNVDKLLNTSDLLPMVLNLLGVKSPYEYIGEDAFDEAYEGYVPFSNGRTSLRWYLGLRVISCTPMVVRVDFGVSSAVLKISARTSLE